MEQVDRTEIREARKRRVRVEVDAPPRREWRPHEILGLALAFGILAGLAETLVVLVRWSYLGNAALGHLQMNKQGLGLITLADAGLILVAGLPSALLACVIRGRWVGRGAILILATLGAYTALQPIRGLATWANLLLALGMGTAIARQGWAHPEGFRRLTMWGLLGLVPAAGIVMAAPFLYESHREAGELAALPAPPAGSPNVLFVVLDTVRADAMGAYGYQRPTTPNLDKLAARGIRFEQARAAGAWTLPSHASMFTGRWPHEMSARIDTPLDDRFPTLAESLRDRGYATAGFAANTWFCNPWYGLARGFVHYEAAPTTFRTVLQSSGLGRKFAKSLGTAETERPTAHLPRKDAPTINRELLKWIDDRDTSRPFFAFLNYFDAHDPYLLAREPEHPFGLRPRTAAQRWLIRDWHLGDKAKVTDEDRTLVRDCYDDGLAYLDRKFGEMLADLGRRGLLESTWIVVTADHGEQFGDHGGIYGHGSSLYRSNFHVPLLIIPPIGQGSSGATVAAPVSLRELPATVLDLAIPKTESAFPGHSLARYWNGSPGNVASPVFYEIVDRPDGPKTDWSPPRAIDGEGRIYLRQHDGREELYDLVADPEQIRNLAGDPAEAETLARLRTAMGTVAAGP